jgi:PAS domain S-box-containing protein
MIPDPVIVTDEAGRITYGNVAVTRVTGFSHAEIIGRTPGSLWGNFRDEGFYQGMWETLILDRQPFESEMTNRRKDGQFFGCTLKIYPVPGTRLKPARFVGIMFDIREAI